MFEKTALQRKSVRNFSDEKFSDALKSDIAELIKQLKPLYDDALTNFKFCPANLVRDDLKGTLVKAPYYIIISAPYADGFLENAGFMAEQLVIMLTAMGIASCYSGMAKPKHDFSVKDEYCITLALGFPDEKEEWRTSEDDFKRKPMEKYLIGDIENDFLEPYIYFARLAPSAMNKQPIVYEMIGDTIDVYRKKTSISALEKMQKIDTGIAISHIFMFAEEHGCHVDIYKKGIDENNKLIYFLSLVVKENESE